jgi:hypothetical protein
MFLEPRDEESEFRAKLTAKLGQVLELELASPSVAGFVSSTLDILSSFKADRRWQPKSLKEQFSQSSFVEFMAGYINRIPESLPPLPLYILGCDYYLHNVVECLIPRDNGVPVISAEAINGPSHKEIKITILHENPGGLIAVPKWFEFPACELSDLPPYVMLM